MVPYRMPDGKTGNSTQSHLEQVTPSPHYDYDGHRATNDRAREEKAQLGQGLGAGLSSSRWANAQDKSPAVGQKSPLAMQRSPVMLPRQTPKNQAQQYVTPEKGSSILALPRESIAHGSSGGCLATPGSPREEPSVQPNTTSPGLEEAGLPKLTALTLAILPDDEGNHDHLKRSNSSWSISQVSHNSQSHVTPSKSVAGNACRDIIIPGAAYDQDNDEVKFDMNFAASRTLFTRWRETVTQPPHKTHIDRDIRNDPSLKHCDIDPTTGLFMSRVDYPDTTMHPDIDKLDTKSRFRQEHVTSNLQVEREMKNRERIGVAFKTKRDLQEVDTSQEDVEFEDEPNPTWPKADCVIRPAAPDDFEALAGIMNHEREEECTTIFEIAPIRASHVRKLFEECKANRRPFIVATEKPKPTSKFMDPSQWPCMETYREFRREFQEFLKARDSEAPEPTKVLGFAVGTEASLGLVSTASAAARYACRLHLVVHPQHRGQKIGTALLDKILSVVYAYHRSLIDYEWSCEEANRIYETPTRNNERQYNKIYIDTYAVHKDTQDIAWKAELLNKFEFKHLTTIEEAVKSAGCPLSRWLDRSLWELRGQDTTRLPDEVKCDLFKVSEDEEG